MEKYYQPEIEEFHVNTEYEVKDSKGNWSRCNDFSNAYDYEDSCLYGLIKDLDKGCIRIKHLDREDIESLGFEENEGQEYYSRKDGFTIEILHPQGLFRIETKEPNQLMFFRLKNKSELKKVLKMIGV